MTRSKKIIATCAIAIAMAVGSAGPTLAADSDTVTTEDRHQTVAPPTSEDQGPAVAQAT
ncbi:hypothetical protein ACWGJ2_06620 [Streptomyces sp. NPDC054796]|uniref:Secreted protein n=1 Tax=Streptomyces daliensis TaxID=299421 RepID=A0A8T4IPH4_9ACTN|nr:hypothetical protein [Streptomyces daliensis]